ncbi:hypothetical protein [Roseiconus lacunae]|uniref:hypothetical protein n=1 Tax=Roseiconus lacunae TaxID=2605694 RepID=UPI001E5854CB|nr:hypothetical protein [Roseiconus lacunae]MCD0463517.1 hypothetical protein [Roseiconus lacunae]
MITILSKLTTFLFGIASVCCASRADALTYRLRGHRRSVACAGVVLALLGSNANADPPAFGAASAGPANEITKFNGTLKGFQRGMVLVDKDGGDQATVALPDNLASFQFIAKAKPAFLKRGMLVRFYGTFGPNGVPVAPITKVTLFQPVDQRAVTGHAREQFKPGVYSEGKDRGKQQAMVTGKYLIVGQLMNLAPNGMMAVQTGKVPVQVQVNPETEFEIRYNNLNLAQEGDAVSVSGFYQPPNENQVKAERITITTDRVYGEPQPNDKSVRGRGKRSQDQADDDKPGQDGADKKESAQTEVKDEDSIEKDGDEAE